MPRGRAFLLLLPLAALACGHDDPKVVAAVDAGFPPIGNASLLHTAAPSSSLSLTGPNNATLAIGGDVDFAKAKALVETYFGSLPPGPEVNEPTPRPAHLAESKRIVLEDKVKLPQLELVWPAVEEGHADAAALDLLAAVLSSSKSSVLDKALTIDQELARSVSAQCETLELAGTFRIVIQANPGTTLDELETKTLALLEQLDAKGVDPAALARAKTVYEARFVRRLETVGMRTNLLAMNNCFEGDPKIGRAHV